MSSLLMSQLARHNVTPYSSRSSLHSIEKQRAILCVRMAHPSKALPPDSRGSSGDEWRDLYLSHPDDFEDDSRDHSGSKQVLHHRMRWALQLDHCCQTEAVSRHLHPPSGPSSGASRLSHPSRQVRLGDAIFVLRLLCHNPTAKQSEQEPDLIRYPVRYLLELSSLDGQVTVIRVNRTT